MGIEIRVSATVPARGMLRRRPSRDALFAAIERSVMTVESDPLARRLVSISRHEHQLHVILHPVAPPLSFEWLPDHSIRATVKTSTVGPGFHAFVVELLRHVERECDLEWNWAGDESGFANSGDFAELQREMLAFLRQNAKLLLSDRFLGSSNIAVNWSPDDPHVVGDYFTRTPLGPFAREWWELVREGSGLDERAMEFYPWWNRERDALFWLGTGQSMLWSEVRWHPPADEAERAVCESALLCFGRAGELDRSLEQPEAELDELQSLLALTPEVAAPPAANRMGFYRGRVRFRGTGAWTVELPGFYYPIIEEDGGAVVFWYGDRVVRVSSLSVAGPDGKTAPAESLIQRAITRAPAGARTYELRTENVIGAAYVAAKVEDVFHLHGCVATGGQLCITTITFAETDDEQWAASVFQSIRFSGAPGADDE